MKRTTQPRSTTDRGPIRTVVVDPFPLTRYGLTALIEAHSDFALVRAVASVRALNRSAAADLAIVHVPDGHAAPPDLTIPAITVHVTDAPHHIVASARRTVGVPALGTGRGSGSLTARELEVVALVAEGQTDHEIADALFLSVRTVRSHLDRIRAKTGQRRRPDLTRWFLSREDDA